MCVCLCVCVWLDWALRIDWVLETCFHFSFTIPSFDSVFLSAVSVGKGRALGAHIKCGRSAGFSVKTRQEWMAGRKEWNERMQNKCKKIDSKLCYVCTLLPCSPVWQSLYLCCFARECLYVSFTPAHFAILWWEKEANVHYHIPVCHGLWRAR